MLLFHPDDTPDALWLYGLTADDHPGPVASVTGTTSPEALPVATGLVAWVAPARQSDWTGPAAEARLANVEVVAPLLGAHMGVVQALHESGTVLPARFGTVFGGQESARRALGKTAEDALAWLERCAGHDELSIKGFVDRAAAVEAIAGPMPKRTSGAAYLKARRARRDAEKGVGKAVVAEASRLADAVVPLCASTRQLPLRSAELAGAEGEMVWNWAVLRSAEQSEALAGVIEAARPRLAAAGITVQVGGALPAWSFVDDAL